MRWLPMLAALPLLVAGCDGADNEVARPATPTETASVSAVVTSSGCPNESSIAADISKRFPPTLIEDVDGDGTDERISMHLDPEGPPECLAFTVVEKADASYSGVIVPASGADPLNFGRILGAAQIDGEPGIDVAILVAAGASTQFASVYHWGETSLVPMRVRGGDGSFAFGGSAGHLDVVDCFSEGLIVATSAVRSGKRYKVVRRFFEPKEGAFLERRDLTERMRLWEDDLSSVPEFRSGPFATCPTS